MKLSLFDFNNYKSFLNDLIDSYPKAGRGVRKALSQAIGCQIAYITHVLSGESHFSLEQAEAATRFFSLNKDETEFFILLVQSNRAGTANLKKFFEPMIEEKRQKNLLLKNRLKIKETLPEKDQSIYYSNWQYAATHMLLTLPDCNSPNRISEKLKVTPKRALEILEFLTAHSLFNNTAGLFYTFRFHRSISFARKLILQSIRFRY